MPTSSASDAQKTALHPVHGHVDNAPQYKGKGDAGNAQHRLYCNQNAYQKLGFSRYDAEPL